MIITIHSYSTHMRTRRLCEASVSLLAELNQL